jgi:short-subunit dehydrogenase
MKHILITGAGSGLGKALASQLAEADTHLVLLDISEKDLGRTTELLQSSGAMVSQYIVDIADGPNLESCLRKISRLHQTMDWVFNCAGITITGRAVDISPVQWRRILAVNILGITTITNHFLSGMLERRSGKIINIASMFGLMPAPSGIAYATSKHALVGFTRTLMVELKGTGVDVHLVCPGFIQTNLFENATYVGVDKNRMLPDIKTMMTTEEAARRIIQALTRQQRWIVFPIYVRVLWWIEWLFPTLASYVWTQQWNKFLKQSKPSNSEP